MKRKTKAFVFIALLVILCTSVYVLGFRDKTTYVNYKTFYDKIENEEIVEVKISEDKIYFKEKNNEEFYTDNSDSDLLKEKLLLNDIKVKTEDSFLDIFYDFFDILFVVIFIAGIIILYRRLSGKTLFKITRHEKTRFCDVVGMDDLKSEMMQIVDIMKNKNDYLKKGIKQPRGIILEGDPGNGKTLFARALAGEANMNFIATKGADFESAVAAVGPQKIKALFRVAKKHAPSIIFIDEFDGIGTRRNYSGNAIETENTRIVTALLNELDGFKETEGVFVIAATNNSKVLDPALVRAGRFDRKYLIPYPNEEDRINLIKYYTKNMTLDKDININKLATIFKGASSSKIATIINEACIAAERKNNGIVNEMCIQYAIELTKEK